MARAGTPEELAEIALRVMRRIGRNKVMFAGPIETGSNKSPDENRRKLMHIMSKFQGANTNVTVFDHLVFLKRLKAIGKAKGIGSDQLRERFDRKLLESGLVKTVHFVFSWRRSVGATWYNRVAKELGIHTTVIVESPQKRKAAAS